MVQMPGAQVRRGCQARGCHLGLGPSGPRTFLLRCSMTATGATCCHVTAATKTRSHRSQPFWTLGLGSGASAGSRDWGFSRASCQEPSAQGLIA